MRVSVGLVSYTALQAITLTRQRREKSIQTKQQVQLVKDFEKFLIRLRNTFSLPQDDTHIRTLLHVLADQKVLLTEAELGQLGLRHKFVDVVCRVLRTQLKAQETRISTDPLPESVKTLRHLKKCVDVGLWDPINKCTDTYALVELLLDWLRILTVEAITPQAVVKLLKFVAGPMTQLPLMSENDELSTAQCELLELLLSVLQTVYSTEEPEPAFTVLALKFSAALTGINGQEDDAGAKSIIPFAAVLKTLAATELKFAIKRRGSTQRPVSFIQEAPDVIVLNPEDISSQLLEDFIGLTNDDDDDEEEEEEDEHADVGGEKDNQHDDSITTHPDTHTHTDGADS